MRGRKPKPSHLRVIDGNPGRRPLNPDEPQPEGDLGAAPEWFTPEQREGWDYAIANAPAGLLKKIDRGALAIWVVAEDLWRQAVEGAARTGLLIRTKAGPQQNPFVGIQAKQALIMLKAASELGFTPAARPRIKIGKVEQENPFASHGRRG